MGTNARDKAKKAARGFHQSAGREGIHSELGRGRWLFGSRSWCLPSLTLRSRRWRGRLGLARPRDRSRRRGRGTGTHLGFTGLEKFQECRPSGIAKAAFVALDDARVATW